MAFDPATFSGTFVADFGETVIVRPPKGPPRQVKANVRRNLPSNIDGVDGVSSLDKTIEVRNSQLHGIAAHEFDVGWSVDVSDDAGGTRERRTILHPPIEQDESCLVLGVR